MTKDEALRMSLECIEAWDRGANASDYWRDRFDAITAIRKVLAIESNEQPAQHRKPWVGLTNQELIDLTTIYSGAPLYCAIEAKLREKNDHGFKVGA